MKGVQDQRVRVRVRVRVKGADLYELVLVSGVETWRAWRAAQGSG